MNRDHYDRVTSILAPYSNYDNIPEDVLAKAAKRGDEIHKLCQLYAEEGISYPSEYDSYVQAFKDWFDINVEEVIQCEKRYYCDDLEITGQIDLLIKPRCSLNLYIVDIKTCASKQKTWGAQLAAYRYLLEKTEKISSVKRKVLHLKKSGKYTFIDYHTERDEEVFMKALDLYRYFKLNKK